MSMERRVKFFSLSPDFVLDLIDLFNVNNFKITGTGSPGNSGLA